MVPTPQDNTTKNYASDADLEVRGQREIDEVHQFFEEWFTNVLPDEDTHYARFRYVLGEEFNMIDASGRLSERRALLDELRAAHGCWGSDNTGKIWVDDVRLLRRDDKTALFSYQEWQQVDGELRGRRASALFRNNAALPNGLEWLHVHQTYLDNEDNKAETVVVV